MPQTNEKWWEDIAALFHATYERLAPSFGYKTREETAVPREMVKENNRRLMTATVAEVMPSIVAEAERRGYERAMEEVKRSSELPTPQEERDFYRYVYSKSTLAQPACLHDGCTNCQGRGVDSLGRMCVHAISCPCPKHNVVC